MKKIYLVFILLLLCSFSFKTEAKTEYRTETHIITKGETLWSIAKQYKPADMDIREYIDMLEKHNGITAAIRENQRIDVLIEM